MSTLFHRHKSRQFNERLRRADKNILLEGTHASLILEAMDEQDLEHASQIIEKLRKIKGKGVKSLDVAIDSAITQLNKYTGGNPLTKAWSNLKSMVGIDNPLVKFMTFANALETGFKQAPKILRNNIEGDLDNEATNQTLLQLVTDPAKQKVLVDNLLKALSPKGVFGAFKKVPYVDKRALVKDLLNIPLKNFNEIHREITTAPSTDLVANDMKSTTVGNVSSKGTDQETSTTGTVASTGTNTTKGTSKTSGTAAPGEKPERPQTNVADAVYQELNNALDDAAGNKQRALAVLKLLADEGKLKT